MAAIDVGVWRQGGLGLGREQGVGCAAFARVGVAGGAGSAPMRSEVQGVVLCAIGGGQVGEGTGSSAGAAQRGGGGPVVHLATA